MRTRPRFLCGRQVFNCRADISWSVASKNSDGSLLSRTVPSEALSDSHGIIWRVRHGSSTVWLGHCAPLRSCWTSSVVPGVPAMAWQGQLREKPNRTPPLLAKCLYDRLKTHPAMIRHVGKVRNAPSSGAEMQNFRLVVGKVRSVHSWVPTRGQCDKHPWAPQESFRDDRAKGGKDGKGNGKLYKDGEDGKGKSNPSPKPSN